ncbi:MAG: hypothetical protein HPY90_10485 [Syntrophothermus sp.]|nr:hypothetical protein [Syntrophothermus sp.]NSW83675.1 hypothetical protein [Syntrophothermus sp.]
MIEVDQYQRIRYLFAVQGLSQRIESSYCRSPITKRVLYRSTNKDRAD